MAGHTVLVTFVAGTPSLLDTRTRAETVARIKAAQAVSDQARIQLQQARDGAAFSRSELERQRQIATFGGITDERLAAVEMDARTKEAQAKASELALQRAEHELEAARATLQRVASPQSAPSDAVLALRSPVDGIVLRVLHESETPVAAGTPLIEIGNPNQLEVVADLMSTDAVNVQAGYRVIITGWGGGVPLGGRVRLVEPAGFTKVSALGVEEQRVNVLINFEETEGEAPTLGDGYRVEASIIVWERNEVLKIPTSALFRIGDAWAAFAIHHGRAVETTVQIGRRSAVEAEVLAGLLEGDHVIVHPGDTVAHGVRVTQR